MIVSAGKPTKPNRKTLMLWNLSNTTTFTDVKLAAGEDVRLLRCSGCGALVRKEDKIYHQRFHNDLREVARKVSRIR